MRNKANQTTVPQDFGALLTDHAKAFDYFPHELLIAELHAYGVHIPSLKLLQSYLTKRKQRVKLNCTISLILILPTTQIITLPTQLT